MRSLIECSGTYFGDVFIPQFTLCAGQCVNVIWPPKRRLQAFITAVQNGKSSQSLVIAEPFANIWQLVVRDHTPLSTWLSSLGVEAKDQAQISDLHQLNLNDPLYALGETKRLIVAFEASMRLSRAFIMSDAGLDPLGSEALIKQLNALADRALLFITYPTYFENVLEDRAAIVRRFPSFVKHLEVKVA